MERSSCPAVDQTAEAGQQRESIAITGIGCRLPGRATSPVKLWELLVHGRSGHCAVPRSKYNSEGFYHPNPDRPGSINSTGGYFIQEDIHAFENAFFGINNLEAREMDSQQRQLLEVVYETFENAGKPLECVQGSNTGVFIGNFTNDSTIMQYKEPEYFSRYSATGTGTTILSNRITYCFDLRGPSVVLDTACSSSLYALHSACLALDAYDCDAAIVASANLIQSPEQQLIAVKAGILSPDSKSHTFDESANGYGRAEGISALYLKRVSDAIRDGDQIRAVIRGTAVNGNGRTPGIVQPSVKGQEAVIRAAYRRARLETNETDYVELHGTGTKVGDPIEVESVSRVFQHRSGRPTLIGGIKPNLGHSEGASGISSIIKLVLALESGIIPATIGIENVNPAIKLDHWNIKIARTNQRWPDTSIRRGGVNSFGFGGANGHVIIESATQVNLQHASAFSSTETTKNEGPQILMFSAATKNSLIRQIQDIVEYACQKAGSVNFPDLIYTLNCCRSRLAARGYLIASPSSFTFEPAILRPTVEDDGFSAKLPLTFVYTGQGAQWPGMGRELLQQYSTFQETIRYLDHCLQSLRCDLRPLWTIEATILDIEGGSSIHLAEKSQAVCTAVQIALTDLLVRWNVRPITVLGHSSGEIAAAYAAGHITSRQAILAAFLRGLAVSECDEKGAMLATGLGRSQLQDIITELGLQHRVCVACVNSPENSTLSGDSTSIDQLEVALQQRGVFVKRLNTNDKAYHSYHMKAVGPNYQNLLVQNWVGATSVPKNLANDHGNKISGTTVHMMSSATKSLLDAQDFCSPAYWRANLESSVEFAGAIEIVLGKGQTHFIEIGPHSTLELPIKQTATYLSKSSDWYLYNSSLVRGKDAVSTILQLVGSLFLCGHDELCAKAISEREIGPVSPTILTDLPTYPWDRTSRSLWNEPRIVSEFRERKYPRHDLLGSQTPGGNKATMTWRNILDINELQWLKDHCLGPSIVFPAAAYIVMAVEAVRQVNGLRPSECPGVSLQNLAFLKALDFDVNHRPKVEIFTEIRRYQISSTVSSNKWWHFSVFSISKDNSQGTTHVNGLVKLMDREKVKLERRIRFDEGTLEQQATHAWYSKFREEGLNWGPKFAVLEDIFCDKAREAMVADATTHLIRDDDFSQSENFKYIVHPISLDAMLQTAFVATTAGVVRDLRATVPVSIESIDISCPSILDMDTGKQWRITTQSERVGFGAVNIKAELVNSSDHVLVRMTSVRAVRFQGNTQTDISRERQPLARVTWKPDITKLASGANDGFSDYLDWYTRTLQHEKEGTDESTLRLLGALDLVTFKRPNMRILAVNLWPVTMPLVMNVLRANATSRRFGTFVHATSTENGELCGVEICWREGKLAEGESILNVLPKKRQFDVIVIASDTATYLSRLPWLAPNGLLIFESHLQEVVNFDCDCDYVKESVESSFGTHVVRHTEGAGNVPSKEHQIVIVSRGNECLPIDTRLQKALTAFFGQPVPIIDMSEVNDTRIPAKALVISTAELISPFLSTMDLEEMKALKALTNRAARILWLTNVDVLSGTHPDFALVFGLARALMLEQPSIQFATFDVDEPLSGLETTVQNICKAFEQLITEMNPELEFAQKKGVIHILRWEPEDPLNEHFRRKQNEETIDLPLKEAGRCELSIRDPGQFDTIRFTTKDHKQAIPADEVEVEVKSVGLNAKDLYVLGSKVDTKDASCSCECAGVITAVGANVSNFTSGDRVVAMAPGHFATYERFPQWAVCRLHDTEDFNVASTIPIVFSTAIYGLRYRADLQPGESVLIHSATGGVGIAAIQLAKQIGAEIFATVGNETKRNYLVDTFGLKPSHIFDSRDASFLDGVLAVTNGRGVDVVLNSLAGDLLHESFKACADFGRFIEIGKRDIADHGCLDMATFGRSVSFMAFDLSSLFLSKRKAHHELWQRLLMESMDLVRTGIALPCSPLTVFDAAHVMEAFRHFSRGARMGKVAVSFQEGSNKLKLLPDKYQTNFNPGKSYLMIGCLGGVGRSLARWMLMRGARYFVFLHRTGLGKPAARTFIEYLSNKGATAEVVRADVGNYEDVELAIRQAKLPIGGVIQGAMVLGEALWSAMSMEKWHATLRPKVQGTWNLHNALRKDGRDAQLDFFLTTSSISGTVGTATESNYCAANAFLDAFARYRNSLGLPAVSVGYGMIAEVGYLHEHPEIEILLRRKGIHAINEDEMLQITDLAIAHQSLDKWQPHYDHLASSHMLTGIEFVGLQEQRDRGFEGDNHVLVDPRASLFAAAFERSSAAAGSVNTAIAHDLPEELASMLAEGGEEASILDAVRTMVTKKIANLILLPTEKLRPEQTLGEFGLDSMLAAEFRTYIFRTLEVDIPFMMILDRLTTVNGLSEVITSGLKARGNQ